MTPTIAFLRATSFNPYLDAGEYNGYVAVPPEHPLFGENIDNKDVANLRVHGGVTFAGPFKDVNDVDVYLDCEEPPCNWWAFGFDTVHYGDNADKWNLETCTEETRRLQIQLEELFAQSK